MLSDLVRWGYTKDLLLTQNGFRLFKSEKVQY